MEGMETPRIRGDEMARVGRRVSQALAGLIRFMFMMLVCLNKIPA